MIVGLDLDEVLCGLLSCIQKFLLENHDFHFMESDLVDYHLERLPCLPSSISKEVVENIYNGRFAREALPTPYAEHSLNKLRMAGFKIHIITHRHEYLFRPITEEWLDKHNLYYDELHMVYNKHDVIEKCNIDAMVDDRFDVLSTIYRSCGELKYGLYCIDAPWNYRFNNMFVWRVADVSVATNRIISALRGNANEDSMS